MPTPRPQAAQAEITGSIGLGPHEVCAGPVHNGIVCSVFPQIVEEVEAAS